ncbi:metal-dependent hydrolase family protein [Paramicrobacterium chengjingii]|uniref:Amidohydrolase family protein n=1 Tax=Paramicrobacterium chengjingii TaxID=2769067 RepID=A0ABX6YI96_9MICO|nr:amidohydrolase family protein [Microbacterium chengjingii]QPZ38481.1 amidohydrolase family protein [Microbacterium chengjingii]
MMTAFALTHVTVVTGDSDGTVMPDHTVLVAGDGTIERVGPTDGVDVPPGYRVIGGAGKFVMPGLINAHAHLFSDGKPLPPILLNDAAEKAVSVFMRSPVGGRWLKRRAKKAVLTQMQTGVTTIRSLGDPGYEVVKVALEIDRGAYTGPRVIASGPLLAVSGGHGAPQIALISDNPWDARRNVRVNLRHGVTAIKIAATGGVTDAKVIGEAGRPQMTEEEMTAICEEAHNAGILVAAHAQSPQGIVAALRAGVDTIEHGASMTDEIIDLFTSNPRALHGSSALVPTFMAALPIVTLPLKATGVTEINRANAVMVLDEMRRGVADALDNDIALGMGTDSSLTFVTHYNTWREIDFVMRHGNVPAARALHAATQSNAKILGVDGVTGTVEAGKSADLIVTDANPLDDISTLAQPHAVAVGGSLLESPSVERFPEIDELLDTI